MANDRTIGVLFDFNNKNQLTLVDNRSRNKFKRLLENWTTKLKDSDKIKSGETFEYIDLFSLLNMIESHYKVLEQAPATERIARGQFKLINQIKVINNIPLENKQTVELDDNDEEEDDDDKE